MAQYAEQTATQTNPKSTECGAIYNEMLGETERFLQNLNRLESFGHKLKDTNIPQKGEAGMTAERPSGFLPDMANAIGRFRGLNIRMEEVLYKLEEII